MSYEYRKFSVTLAKRCAWRAVYIYGFSRVPRFYIGIDPTTGSGPQLFGGWQITLNRAGSFRFNLPSIHWKHPHGRAWLMAYRVSSRFWHNMDGRYGWFTPKVKKYRL